MAPAVASQPSSVNYEARHAAAEYLRSRLTVQSDGAKKPFDIPVIDISPSFSSSQEDRLFVAAQIRDACTNSGFFHITGHGISSAIRDAILKQAERFFKTLPLANKEALHIRHSKHFRGWEDAGFSYVNPADWKDATIPESKEAFNWGYEEALDSTGGDGKYVELDGTTEIVNVWPSEDDLPGFFEGIRQYYSQVLDLSRHMFRLFALSLDLPEDHFAPMTTHPGGIARLIWYPKQRAQEKETGLGAHSDYECFTLVLASAGTGLEILSPDGVWTSVPTTEGGFIVNIADFFMRWTNGLYKSTVHRVINQTMDERYSVPFFFSVNYDEVVETLPSCVSPENPSKYPPIRAGEYILERLRATTNEG